MSTKFKLDGCPISLAIRSPSGREYKLYFDREAGDLTLKQLKKINWEKPVIDISQPKDEREVYLPEGAGFKLKQLTYSSVSDSWCAEISVETEYLGDITIYQEQIDTLTAQTAEQQSALTAQEQEIISLQDQLAEADELAIALFEAQKSTDNNEEVV